MGRRTDPPVYMIDAQASISEWALRSPQDCRVTSSTIQDSPCPSRTEEGVHIDKLKASSKPQNKFHISVGKGKFITTFTMLVLMLN
ncbi:hypothetical protein GUJ93_ZPchr0006g43626 [Zizania palustris]|uniref:Uncharacterized protein n=1 Tax=Zizania palustris TaxID=103762 RepID=A0A8J5SYI7_ZIZPA|nr:hypothetical protein GUJ93_ZPchr0006g43626 [Zizania palustris]